MFRRLDMSHATDLCYEASVFREFICMTLVLLPFRPCLDDKTFSMQQIRVTKQMTLGCVHGDTCCMRHIS